MTHFFTKLAKRVDTATQIAKPNYGYWIARMKFFLKSIDVFGILSNLDGLHQKHQLLNGLFLKIFLKSIDVFGILLNLDGLHQKHQLLNGLFLKDTLVL
jgi:hypothetical protein